MRWPEEHNNKLKKNKKKKKKLTKKPKKHKNTKKKTNFQLSVNLCETTGSVATIRLPSPVALQKLELLNGHVWLKTKRVCVRQQGPCTQLRQL